MKLLEIQQKLEAPKEKYNSFGKYNYRSCEDILNALKPLLDSPVILTDELIQIGARYYIKATATYGDTSVTAYAREPEFQKGMNDSQITGSASSYARKYAINGLFAIDDAQDADTMDNSDKSKKEVKKEVPKKTTTKKASSTACPECHAPASKPHATRCILGNQQ